MCPEDLIMLKKPVISQLYGELPVVDVGSGILPKGITYCPPSLTTGTSIVISFTVLSAVPALLAFPP